MNERRHVRRDEDAERQHSPAPRPERRENRETATILDLQASAGNRAVQALLETHEADPAQATLQRQPVDQAPGAEPPTDARTSALGNVTIPDMQLTMPILSFSRQVKGPSEAKSEAGEVVVAIALESLDAGVPEAAAKGRHFDTITVAIGSRTFTLRSVVFSSFNVNSETATLSLNFTSMTVE